jgi:hypothetical protein
VRGADDGFRDQGDNSILQAAGEAEQDYQKIASDVSDRSAKFTKDLIESTDRRDQAKSKKHCGFLFCRSLRSMRPPLPMAPKRKENKTISKPVAWERRLDSRSKADIVARPVTWETKVCAAIKPPMLMRPAWKASNIQIAKLLLLKAEMLSLPKIIQKV